MGDTQALGAKAVPPRLLRRLDRLVARQLRRARQGLVLVRTRVGVDRAALLLGHRRRAGRRAFHADALLPLRARLGLLRPVGAAYRHLVALGRRADRLERALRLVDVAVGEQHAEFLAAVAVGDAAAIDLREPPADQAQHLVADVVPVRVVEL